MPTDWREEYKLSLRDNSICTTARVFLSSMKRQIQLYLHSQLTYTMMYWSYKTWNIKNVQTPNYEHQHHLKIYIQAVTEE